MRAQRWIGVAWLVVMLGVVSSPERLRAWQTKEGLSKEDREKLEKEASDLNEQMVQRHQEGKIVEALALARRVLGIAEQLYSAKEYPEGHADLAQSMNTVGFMLHAMGEPAKGLVYFEKALAMRQKLYPESRFKDGHPDLDASLSNVGRVLQDIGELAKALGYHEKALAMRQKLYPEARFRDGHPLLAETLTNIGEVQLALEEPAKALGYCEKALAMRQRLYPETRFKAGHPNLAESLNNVGRVLEVMGELVRALGNYEKAYAMYLRIYPEARFKDGHPDLATCLNNLCSVLVAMGEPARAQGYAEKALAMRQRLYPEVRFKDGHPRLAASLSNVGRVLQDLGEPTKALNYHEKALAMRQRLYPEVRFKYGHRLLAISLNNMGGVLNELGEQAKSLNYYEKALAMWQRLYPEARFKDGHPDLARGLSNLGGVLNAMGEPAKALGYCEKALAMRQQLYPEVRFKEGHPDLAISLTSLGYLMNAVGEPAKASVYYEKALAMYQKLYPEDRFKDGHPDLALCLNSLGGLLHAIGEPAKGLDSCEKALSMYRRLYPEARFKDGHPDLARCLNNLGGVLNAMGEPAKALDPLKRSVTMYRKQADREIAAAPEGQALAFLQSLPRTQSAYLSAAVSLPAQTASAYEAVWPGRVALLRLMQRRHESTQVALLKSDDARKTWQELSDVRRQVSRLLIEPGKDTAARDKAIQQLERDQDHLERAISKLLPELEEHKQLARLGPKDLAAKLPARSAFIDFVRFTHFSKGKDTGDRYLAFVLTPDARVQCLELGDAAPIDTAIASWRRSLAAREATAAPARLRALVWDKVEAALPAGTRTLYLGLDGDLPRLPFAALPGRKPDSVLLEDYAIAVVPAGAWLLQQLGKPAFDDKAPSLVAVGDVDFGPGTYQPLPESGRELTRVVEALGGTPLRGKAATAAALRKLLPDARIAHLATHAYYDAKSLAEEHDRAQKQLKTWTLREAGTDRAGLAARNPLGFVGLVLAGGNDPAKADGGGILTGLDVLELPLGKLHLCVLSACETGLGRWDEQDGVAGLHRAFHVAGCRNVVGSLWNVNDAATAALMTQFYHELRVNKRPPLAALREAQLTIYRHPDRIAALAGERGKPDQEKAAKLGSAKGPAAAKGAKADTKLWAAFVLSGAGN